MPVWPIAAREARAAARTPRTYAVRAAVTAIGIAMIPLTLWNTRSLNTGHAVFGSLTLVAYFYCLFGAVMGTADTLAEEKRQNTLGLLFLTDLGVGDVLIGKFLASTGSLVFGLIAFLPLLVTPLLMGGVASAIVVDVSLSLLNTLFFSVSWGFLISAVVRTHTLMLGLAVALGFGVLIPIIALQSLNGLEFPIWAEVLLVLSPATAMLAATGAPAEFWPALVQNHLFAWAILLSAAFSLPRFWQEGIGGKRAEQWWIRVRRIQFGGTVARKKFRARLLDSNPLFWLSGREQVSSGGLMLFLLVVAACSAIGNWTQVLIGLALLHVTILVRMASAASHSLAEDRKSGALELLLGTSLSVPELLRGRWMALGRQFFGPMLIVTLWHLFTVAWLALVNFDTFLYLTILVAWFVVAMGWAATGWYGMWLGLRARTPASAVWGTITLVLLAPGATFCSLYGLLTYFRMLPPFIYGAKSYFIFVWFIWAIYLLIVSLLASMHVKALFRQAASDRYRDIEPFDWRPLLRIGLRVAAMYLLMIIVINVCRQFLNPGK